MSVGTWQPDSTTNETDQIESINKLLEEVFKAELLDPGAEFDAQFIARYSWVMKLDAGHWRQVQALDNDQLVHLIRFFTLAEMEFAGWQAGRRSPVIYLVAELKKREAFEPELRKWIKRNSDNRYLPNGAVL